jgi:hypothetical protein
VIYAIRAVGTGKIKFGFTEDVTINRRLSSLQIGCPVDLEVVVFAPGSPADEYAIHARLVGAGKHARGEWFNESPDTDAVVAELKAIEGDGFIRTESLGGRLGRALSIKRAVPQRPKRAGQAERKADPARPKPIANTTERRRLERMAWWRAQNKWKKTRSSKSGSQASQQPSLPQSSMTPSKDMERANQFIGSLLNWESNTLRSIANSLSTESQSGETPRSAEPLQN